MTDPELSVVIPVHDEAENVTPLSKRLIGVLEDYGPTFEVIFVEDGSTDATFECLRALRHMDERIKIIRFTRNYGQTAALQAGFHHAKGQIVVAMDGDLQFHPEDLPAVVDKLHEGYDIVSGWRDRSSDPTTRSLPSHVANWMMAAVSGVRMRDFGSTFKAYRRDAVQHLKLYGELHRFIPALASRYGARMIEVPVQWSPRLHGKSHYGLTRTWRVFLDLIAVKFLLAFSSKPLRLFGSLGLFCLGLGFLSGLLALLMKLPALGGYSITGNPFLILCALFIITGVQFITNGLLAEMLTRTYYESGTIKRIYTIREVLE